MVYAFVNLEISNPAPLAEYKKVSGDALAKHKGAVVASSKVLTRLDGEGALPSVAVLLSFSDREHALAWANDPELEGVHALRRNAGVSDIVLLG